MLTGMSDTDLLTDFISDAIQQECLSTDLQEKFLVEKPFLDKCIQKRCLSNPALTPLMAKAIYYLVDTKPFYTKMHWPLTEDELSPFFHDLGKGFET